MTRGERVAILLQRLMDRPGWLWSLAELGTDLGVAKSTLSEDLAAVRRAFAAQGRGVLQSVPGPVGGVRYLPLLSAERLRAAVEQLAEVLSPSDRILPGGFIFMSDVLFSPYWSALIGQCFASAFLPQAPDVVVTVETKGIPIALMTARALGVPMVLLRRDVRVTEGSSVSINYLSASSGTIHTMSVPRRALRTGMRALVVDDFMKAGGTAAGMLRLLQEVGVQAAAVGVVVATALPAHKRVQEYRSLLTLGQVREDAPRVPLYPARWISGEPDSKGV